MTLEIVDFPSKRLLLCSSNFLAFIDINLTGHDYFVSNFLTKNCSFFCVQKRIFPSPKSPLSPSQQSREQLLHLSLSAFYDQLQTHENSFLTKLLCCTTFFSTVNCRCIKGRFPSTEENGFFLLSARFAIELFPKGWSKEVCAFRNK